MSKVKKVLMQKGVITQVFDPDSAEYLSKNGWTRVTAVAENDALVNKVADSNPASESKKSETAAFNSTVKEGK